MTGIATDPSGVRTVAFVGPPESGKSTLFTQLVTISGRMDVGSWGRLRAATVTHDGVVITMLDTCGHPDFDADVQAAVRAVDNVVFVVSATAGVDAPTIDLWQTCARQHIPRYVVVTHLDEDRADYDEAVAICQRVFGPEVVALHYPVLTDNDTLGGLIDIVTMRVHDHSGTHPVIRDADPEHVTLLTPARQRVGEAILAAAIDPTVINAVVGEQPLTSPAFTTEVTRSIASGDLAPVLVGGSKPSGLAGEELLHFFAIVLASPTHSPHVTVTDLDGNPASPLTADPHGSPYAQIIATRGSDHIGDLVRVFSGTLRPGVIECIGTARARPGIIEALRYPNIPPDIDAAVAGTIVMVQGLADLSPGDTLASPNSPLRIEPWPIARPLHTMRVHHAPIGDVASFLAVDPTVRVDGDVLWCMGDQHAAKISQQLRERFGDAVQLVPAPIRLRETIAHAAVGSFESAQSHVTVAAHPQPLGAGISITVECGDPDRHRFVESAVRDHLSHGPLAGFPMTDVDMTVTASVSPDVSDDTLAAEIRNAVNDALRRADPYLLEPLSLVTVRIPSDDLEAVSKDMTRRRGTVIETTNEPGGTTHVIAQAPESAVARYAIELGNVSQDGELCAMQDAGFAALPKYLAARY